MANRDSVERMRKLRLLQLVEVARAYRGCTKNELAAKLDRDPAKIVPESGNPKLDLVVGLADALTWSVTDVVEAIWGAAPEVEPPSASFEELDREAIGAHRDGDFVRMIRLGQQMMMIATDGRQRASAACRVAGGFEGQGIYLKAVEWMQAASREVQLPAPSIRVITANLASCHYSLGNVREALALARDVATSISVGAPTERRDQVALALSRYVEGSSLRRQLASDPVDRVAIGELALSALEHARVLYSKMSADYGDDSYAGVANACVGAALEVEALLGRRSADEALKRILDALEGVRDVGAISRGDWLESWGWWAVFGCNIAQRHLDGEERDRALAILTNKASEVAERQGNWSLREQVFTVEFVQRCERGAPDGDTRESWVLDADDLRNLVGAMGRFPNFRSTGWRILSVARVIGTQGGPQ